MKQFPSARKKSELSNFTTKKTNTGEFFMSKYGFLRNNGPQIQPAESFLNEAEQQAKRVGARINEYIAHINNRRTHREAIGLAGGSLEQLDAEQETGGWS